MNYGASRKCAVGRGQQGCIAALVDMSDTDFYASERAADVREEYEQIYGEQDPRAYFRVLYGLDYRMPELARPVFRNVIRAAAGNQQSPARVLDLGCGFGTNAALLRYPIDLNRLAHRYRDLDGGDLLPEQVMELDRNYYASWPQTRAASFIGFDLEAAPVSYALGVGLVDHGFACDLEEDDLAAGDAAALRGVSCVISTGCAGYAGVATFTKLLDAIGEDPPWLAIMVLRTEPFDAVRECLMDRGLVVEKLEGVTFIQRRYHSASEWTQALLALETLGIDTQGKEADGLMHAEFYLARPAHSAEEHPLESVVSVSSGGEGTFGGWRGRPWGT